MTNTREEEERGGGTTREKKDDDEGEEKLVLHRAFLFLFSRPMENCFVMSVCVFFFRWDEKYC